MQPYLAYNLRTDTQTINLVWTLGFSGFLLGSLFTSNIFTKYLTTSNKKLRFMSLVLLFTGVSTLMIPFMSNLPILLLCRFVQVLLSNAQPLDTLHSFPPVPLLWNILNL